VSLRSYFLDARTYFAERGSGAMYAKSGQLQRLCTALVRGKSIRAAAREAGCSRVTARKLHRILLADFASPGQVAFRCACGKPSTHRGFCSARFRESPRRQAFMRRWHTKDNLAEENTDAR